MSELKIHHVYRTRESVFLTGCPMYKCSDVDPKLDEIARLKEMLNEAADTLIDNDDYTVQALNSIGHDLKREAAK